MSGRGKSKAKIHMSKPDLPPFLQRMKEQIVANEDVERREQSQKKRKDRSGRTDETDDDPTIVKIGDDDLTEEEYKRMKTELETQYKMDNERSSSKPLELDVDDLIQSRPGTSDLKAKEAPSTAKQSRPDKSSTSKSSTKSATKKIETSKAKQLSYGSSSEDDE